MVPALSRTGGRETRALTSRIGPAGGTSKVGVVKRGRDGGTGLVWVRFECRGRGRRRSRVAQKPLVARQVARQPGVSPSAARRLCMSIVHTSFVVTVQCNVPAGAGRGSSQSELPMGGPCPLRADVAPVHSCWLRTSGQLPNNSLCLDPCRPRPQGSPEFPPSLSTSKIGTATISCS